MRNGGKDIESVETAGPATLDFMPNRPGQPKRFVKGDRIWITYGDDNRIQSFEIVNASTRTDKPRTPGKPAPPPALTESKDLFATFDPGDQRPGHLDQKTDFHYRRAIATGGPIARCWSRIRI